MQNSAQPGIAFGLGRNLGVTAISSAVFGELAKLGAPVSMPTGDSKKWRNHYTESFAAAVPIEFSESADSKLERLLDCFMSLAQIQQGGSLRESMADAWKHPELVELRIVSGSRPPMAIALPDSEWSLDAIRQVDWGLAEPGLTEAASRLDGLSQSIDLPPLIAFAGGAELSSVPHWLSWGGDVLLLARTTGNQLAELESLAETSAGRLWVVREAASGKSGIDLVARPDLAAAAVSKFLASNGNRTLLFGHFGYAPGIAHLRLEAVAQCLMELLLENVSPKLLQFSWLATPTDSLAVPESFAKFRIENWRERSRFQRIAELPWRALGYLRPPRFIEFQSASGEALAVLDSAARLQGPSYSLAKRMQRWRAQTLRSRGATISYQITPPARTDSVLRHKMLRATYRGAARFGLHPFDSYSASVWPAALFALDSLPEHRDSGGQESSATDWYFARAIHAGLWRTRYQPSSIWVPATVAGLLSPAREEKS